MHFPTTSGVLLALASLATANITVNNNCPGSVYLRQANNGMCGGLRNGSTGSPCPGNPLPIAAGGQTTLKPITDGTGVSIKIAKDKGFMNGVLQYEYSVSDNFYYDLSDLNGAAGGSVGAPFEPENVEVVPTGQGVGSGTCKPIRCAAGTVCQQAYDTPTDVDTRGCASTNVGMDVALCVSNKNFGATARSFTA